MGLVSELLLKLQRSWIEENDRMEEMQRIVEEMRLTVEKMQDVFKDSNRENAAREQKLEMERKASLVEMRKETSNVEGSTLSKPVVKISGVRKKRRKVKARRLYRKIPKVRQKINRRSWKPFSWKELLNVYEKINRQSEVGWPKGKGRGRSSKGKGRGQWWRERRRWKYHKKDREIDGQEWNHKSSAGTQSDEQEGWRTKKLRLLKFAEDGWRRWKAKRQGREMFQMIWLGLLCRRYPLIGCGLNRTIKAQSNKMDQYTNLSAIKGRSQFVFMGGLVHILGQKANYGLSPLEKNKIYFKEFPRPKYLTPWKNGHFILSQTNSPKPNLQRAPISPCLCKDTLVGERDRRTDGGKLRLIPTMHQWSIELWASVGNMYHNLKGFTNSRKARAANGKELKKISSQKSLGDDQDSNSAASVSAWCLRGNLGNFGNFGVG